MSFLQIQGVTKKFGTQHALNDVDVTIEKGELVCILGPSGCGKTTLLRVIAGLTSADSGRIVIDGRDVTHLPPAKRDFGIVFQSYALFPNMTVLGNVLFALKQKGGRTRDEMEQRAIEVLRMVDLFDHRTKYPRQLSGGQQQRTALSRAIAIEPSFLLLDEPLSALDAKVRTKLRTEIRAIQKQLGVTTVMVTHDQDEALTMADRVIVMNNAVVEQTGTPREIYDSPASAFVAGFIGSMNFLGDDGEDAGERWAIRPENIQTVAHDERWDIHAKVTDVEFKGAITRVHGVTGDDHPVAVDLTSRRARTLDLYEGKVLYLRLPEEHLSAYTGVTADDAASRRSTAAAAVPA